jgi:dCMP deaminase
MIDNQWDKRFLELASLVGSWSKDPSTKIGAVIVDLNRRVVSTGYNGFPRGLADDPTRLSVRETKLEMIIHGEINAILFAQRNLDGCTLYTTPLMPCSRCAAIIIQSGIKRVVAPYLFPERWAQQFELALSMFKESGVIVDLIEERSDNPSRQP